MSSLCVHLYVLDKSFSPELLQNKCQGICDWCGNSGPNLWLCLYRGCLKTGCGENCSNHSLAHNSQYPSHCIAINLSNLKAWCYMCEIEVTSYVIGKLSLSTSQHSHLGGPVNMSRVPLARPATPDSSAEEDDDRLTVEEDIKPKGLVGLRNMGLTCYMNAALQALSNSIPLACFIKDCPAFLRMDRKHNGIVQPFHRLIEEMWHLKRPSYVTPSALYHSFRTLYPMFRPYTQQDSQEFLRYFMDQLHEELRQPCLRTRDSEEESNEDAQDDDDHDMSSLENLSEREDTPNDSHDSCPSDAEEYETCDSGLSDQSGDAYSSSSLQPRCKKKKRQHNMSSPESKWIKYGVEQDHSEFSDAMSDASLLDSKTIKGLFETSTSSCLKPASSSSTSGFGSSKPSMSSLQSCAMKSSNMSLPTSRINKGLNPSLGGALSPGAVASVGKAHGIVGGARKRKQVRYRSVVSDCFDGVLVSSVQCLTCNNTSSRKETFQDLSLPIPSSDQISLLHQHQPQQSPPHASKMPVVQNSSFNIYLSKNTCDVTGSGWMWYWVWSVWGWVKSWLWGPSVSLFNCLAAFFSADELKGDNMYSCEKCGKLRNGVKYSKVIQLPEILIIHLKRFRHEYMFSSKISQYVSFPIHGLDMSMFVHKACTSQVRTYDLYSVICHHGAVGSGHYTAYSQNVSNGRWYEFDDQCVTEVSLETVAVCEAYVLFYKKSSSEMFARRQRTRELMQVSSREPSLMQFYVSKQWINKFNTFSEPGPIDNSDFLCPHGGVQPYKVNRVEELVMILNQGVWEYLHQVFGGGPVCTSLFECVTCREELEALLNRQKSEYETFIRLHSLFQDEEQPSIVYAISMKWFRSWESFVRGRQQEPPGPIDNSIICTNKQGQAGPKPGSDYAPISMDLWAFFHETYGGGPEIYVRYGIQTSDTEACRGRRESYDVDRSSAREVNERSRFTLGLKSLSTDDIPYSITFCHNSYSGLRQRTVSASEVDLTAQTPDRMMPSSRNSDDDTDSLQENSNEERKVIRWLDVNGKESEADDSEDSGGNQNGNMEESGQIQRQNITDYTVQGCDVHCKEISTSASRPITRSVTQKKHVNN